MTKHFLHQETNKIKMQENKWASHFFILNLVIQTDGSFQQFTISVSQNNPSELLFIALVFHIEMYLLGLQAFWKVLIQVAFVVKNSLFLREGSAGFPGFGKKNYSIILITYFFN